MAADSRPQGTLWQEKMTGERQAKVSVRKDQPADA